MLFLMMQLRQATLFVACVTREKVETEIVLGGDESQQHLNAVGELG
jgi:hypothetical protein